jgi:hypothetical protein
MRKTLAAVRLRVGLIVPTDRDIEQRIKERWRLRLLAAVHAGGHVAGALGELYLRIDGWELHELHAVLVVGDEVGTVGFDGAIMRAAEGCCAGLPPLPEGWCRTCDLVRRRNGGL